MRTFILFVFGDFEDHDETVFFISEIVNTALSVSSLKFVMEDGKNLIIILDSESTDLELTKDLDEKLNIEQVKFYFLFEKNGLNFSKLPKEIKNHFNKTKVKSKKTKIDYDLDNLLDKIVDKGIESLTSGEKKYLDNFDL